MTQETDNYKLEFVKKVLKSSKEKAKFSFKNTESFLKQIQNLPEESLKEYKNASRIKKTYKKSKNENIGGK